VHTFAALPHYAHLPEDANDQGEQEKKPRKMSRKKREVLANTYKHVVTAAHFGPFQWLSLAKRLETSLYLSCWVKRASIKKNR
jgi:hypothetical protein